MKITTGVDIVKIERIEKIAQNPRFVGRCFGNEEIEIYKNRHNSSTFLAGNFAAKEALSKALATGVRGFKLTEVQILRNPLGKPYFVFSGNADELVKRSGLSFDISISHEKDFAIAFVVGYGMA